MQYRKTKIVCSLGPASSTDAVVRDLILAGMNVARLNFSHGTHESHGEAIKRVRRVSAELGIPVAVLLDLKGPEIRTGAVPNDGKVTIKEGDSVVVTIDGCETTAADTCGNKPARVSINWKEAAQKLQSGHRVLIADGLLELEVISVNAGEGRINCAARNTASIGGKKNVNIIGVHANLPIINEQDKKDIAFGLEMDVEYIAASFVSFPHEITEIKKYIAGLGGRKSIIAKIENAEGLENIKEIAELSDGIMVARGDLGVQLPTEQIPLAQKHIIDVCRRVGKPVITATQMLESMIVNPRPTRAELTDVANAVFDGTDAVMLSGETTVGAYPVEAVKTMDRIARTIEESQKFRTQMRDSRAVCFSDARNPEENLGVIMSKAGVEIAESVEAKAIVTPTFGGNTARILSVFRPDEPIFAVTPDEGAERRLQLYWGVSTFLRPQVDDSLTMMQDTMKVVIDSGVAAMSEKIMLIAGLPLQSPTMINTVRVLTVGTVLAQASVGGFSDGSVTRARGRIIHAVSPADAQEKLTKLGGGIFVCKTLTAEYVPVLRLADGVICEGISEIHEDELRNANPRLVWLTHICNAVKKLEYGISVTIDAKQLLVYEGIA